MKLYRFYFLFIICTIIFSCAQEDKKVNSLLLENDKLNVAFTKKDWEFIYSLKLKSEKYGIGFSHWSNKWDKETFIREQERRYALGKYRPEFYSYNLNGDTAEIKNLNTIVLVSDSSKKFIDTMCNYWIFKDKKWLLKDWNIQKNFSESQPGDSTIRIQTDSIHNSIWNKYMNSNN